MVLGILCIHSLSSDAKELFRRYDRVSVCNGFDDLVPQKDDSVCTSQGHAVHYDPVAGEGGIVEYVLNSATLYRHV
jgi:hypothetical protein